MGFTAHLELSILEANVSVEKPLWVFTQTHAVFYITLRNLKKR